mmetsp:Transcript_5469/g.15658  ORF Transcript_5469/g.15658 Transcript_5469/m.15658 type:complete len:302 (-) Transcript_5469:1778-2683(-)
MVGEVTLSPSLTAAAAAGAGGAGAEAVAAAGRAVARMAAAAASAAATAAAGTSAAGAAVARYHAAGEVRPLLEGSEGSQAVGLAPAPAAAQNGDCSRDAGAAAGIEDCFQVAAAVEDAGASAADIAVSLPAPPAGAASHMTAAVAAKMMEHAAAAAVQRGMPAAAVGAPELETDWLASARPARWQSRCAAGPAGPARCPGPTGPAVPRHRRCRLAAPLLEAPTPAGGAAEAQCPATAGGRPAAPRSPRGPCAAPATRPAALPGALPALGPRPRPPAARLPTPGGATASRLPAEVAAHHLPQ